MPGAARTIERGPIRRRRGTMSITTVEVERSGPVDWVVQEEFGFEEIIYEKAEEGIAKVTINRPHVRNAFTPRTVEEMKRAFADVRDDSSVGVAILTGQGEKAFCSGGDQSVRGTPATWAATRSRASTSSTSSARSGPCPSPSSPWWPATPWAAATCST
jgi:hypothetical protein